MATHMTAEDFKEMMESLERQGELVRASKDAARSLLVRLGILTQDGFLTERFKGLNEFGPNKGKPYTNVQY